MAQGIVKHLVSYMAAAQEDNRLISWLSEPYRTILLFLAPIPFSPNSRLTLIHTFTVHTVNTFSWGTQTYPHGRPLFFLNLYSDTLFSLFFFLSFFFYFILFYREKVWVCWRQRKPRRREFQRHVCEVSKQSTSIWTSAVSPAKHISYCHHYYIAFWQGDLSFLPLQPSISSPAEDEAVWNNMTRLGEMFKRVVRLKNSLSLHVPLAHREMCLLVKEMYEMMDW